MFGLKEAEVALLVRAVAGDELDRGGIEERFARATWSGIAEPGDRVAGFVVAALGAARSLTAVVERWSADVFLAELAANGSLGEAELQQGIERWQPRLSSGNAIIALRQAARFGARLRIPSDEGWPPGLVELDAHAPLALWTRGTDEAYGSLGRSMALVGARAATGYGEHITMEASAGLVDRGYSIVSGAAYGIDGMAHRAALASHGLTIAFLAGGVDRFYPSGHDALLTRIVESGMVISELPCGSSPTRWRYVDRTKADYFRVGRMGRGANQATVGGTVLEYRLQRSGSRRDLSRVHARLLGAWTRRRKCSLLCHRAPEMGAVPERDSDALGSGDLI